jgi:hypothetical protein
LGLSLAVYIATFSGTVSMRRPGAATAPEAMFFTKRTLLEMALIGYAQGCSLIPDQGRHRRTGVTVAAVAVSS